MTLSTEQTADLPPVSSGTPIATGTAGLVGWVLFDWAAQPFYSLVITFLFGPYFVNGFMTDSVLGASLWGYATGISQLLAAILAPILGNIADRGTPRKPWIAGLSVPLVVGLCGLWLAVPHQTGIAALILAFYGLAMIGAELTTVFTNAMMPSLVPARRLGTLSGIGWAAGYVGGLISLALVAGLLVADPHSGKTLLGLTPLLPLDPALSEGDRLVGPFCAVWYIIFILPLFLFTPDHPTAPSGQVAATGVMQLFRRLKMLLEEHPRVALFLVARLLYADGLGAIFAFGGIYASTIFGWGATQLGLFGIILIVTGTVSVALGGFIDDHIGSKKLISVMLVVLIIGSIGVLSVDHNHILFFKEVPPLQPGGGLFASVGERVYLAFAMLIGIASGPVQAASRTMLAQLAPADRVTEFFGFFAFSGKVTAFAAPLMIGFVTWASHSQRIGISTCLIFLIGGLILLQGVRTKSALN